MGEILNFLNIYLNINIYKIYYKIYMMIDYNKVYYYYKIYINNKIY